MLLRPEKALISVHLVMNVCGAPCDVPAFMHLILNFYKITCTCVSGTDSNSKYVWKVQLFSEVYSLPTY